MQSPLFHEPKVTALPSLNLTIYRLSGDEIDQRGFREQYLEAFEQHLHGAKSRPFINRIPPTKLRDPKVCLHVLCASRGGSAPKVAGGLYTFQSSSIPETIEICGLMVSTGWSQLGLASTLIRETISSWQTRDPTATLEAVVRILPESSEGERDLNAASARAFTSNGFVLASLRRVQPDQPLQSHLRERSEPDGSVLVLCFRRQAAEGPSC